jgi:hypothetical protein
MKMDRKYDVRQRMLYAEIEEREQGGSHLRYVYTRGDTQSFCHECNGHDIVRLQRLMYRGDHKWIQFTYLGCYGITVWFTH